MAGLRISAVVTSTAQYAMFILSFIKIAVVSRLLTPSEIGAFTLASAVVFLAQFLRVFGTWDYIVAQKELTEEKLRLCFTIVLAAGLAIFAGYMLVAGPLAQFFLAPELRLMIWIMAPSFLILPIGAVALAVMNRNMQFAILSKIRIAATLTDTVVTIALVFTELGVLSLAIGYTAGSVVSVFLVIMLGRGGLIYRPRLKGIGEVLRFGMLSAAGTFLSSIGFSGPALVLGYGTTPVTVGIFGRGQTLITFFRQGIEVASRPVTMAWFAQRAHSDDEATGLAFLRVTMVMAGLAWPVYIGLYFGAPTLVPLLLGEQWQDSIVITQILALGGLFSFYAVIGISIFEGHGLVAKRLRFNLLAQGQRFILLFMALPFGIVSFAFALAASHLISFILISLFLKAETGLRLRDILRSLLISVYVAGLLVALNLALFKWVFAAERLTLSELALYILVMGAGWIASLVMVSHPLWDEIRRFASWVRARASG